MGVPRDRWESVVIILAANPTTQQAAGQQVRVAPHETAQRLARITDATGLRLYNAFMGGFLLVLTLLGMWLLIASIMGWDWSFGGFDMFPVENAFGMEMARWGVGAVGLAFVFVGMGGCG